MAFKELKLLKNQKSDRGITKLLGRLICQLALHELTRKRDRKQSSFVKSIVVTFGSKIKIFNP